VGLVHRCLQLCLGVGASVVQPWRTLLLLMLLLLLLSVLKQIGLLTAAEGSTMASGYLGVVPRLPALPDAPGGNTNTHHAALHGTILSSMQCPKRQCPDPPPHRCRG
jgi:hypothetical protein